MGGWEGGGGTCSCDGYGDVCAGGRCLSIHCGLWEAYKGIGVGGYLVCMSCGHEDKHILHVGGGFVHRYE